MDDTDNTTPKLPSDTELILNSIKELSRQISGLQSQIREMRQEINYANNMRRQSHLNASISSGQNPFNHSNEPPHRFANNNYNNDYYNNLLGAGRHY